MFARVGVVRVSACCGFPVGEWPGCASARASSGWLRGVGRVGISPVRAVILVKFIAAMAAAIAAFGTAVFSWAGAALVVEEAGVNSGLIWAAIGALGTQAQQLIGLHGETIDNSTFPGGHWPDPIAGSFNDGSVKDGHADWSLNK